MAYVGVKPAAITSATEAEIAGDLTVDTNTLKVDSSNNRVGVLTTSPATDVHVQSSGTAKIRLETTATNGTAQFEAKNDARQYAFGVDDTDKFFLYDSTGGASRLVVDTSGNVGIGLTSLAYSTAATQLSVGDTGGNGGMNIVSGTSSLGVIRFADGTAGSDPYRGRIEYDHSSDHLMFGTSGTERMRIKNNGRVSVGFTGDIGPAIMQLDGGSGCALGIRAGNGTGGYFNQVLFANNGNTALIGSIQRVNNASIQYNTTSDARLKENIADMTGAITRVKQLAPKRYSWVEEDLDAADQDGFLAHEAQAVVPGAASGTQDEVDGDGNPVYMQMDYSKLVPLLTGALKEAIAKIETLETEMTALKARVTALEDA